MAMTFPTFMLGGGWAVFALAAAIFSAAFYLINQYFRQPGSTIVLWMRLAVIILMTPWMIHIELPDDPMFYVVVAVTAVLGTLGDVRMLDVSAKYGGGVVSRVMPMTVWGSFFLWFFFRPELIDTYLSRPLNSVGILLALGGCVYFASRLKHCVITKSALTDMLPALVAYTFAVVLNKRAMDYGAGAATFEGVVYTYMYFQCIVGLFLVGGVELWRRRKTDRVVVPKKQMAIAAALAALIWIGHMVYKNYAMSYTPNPSYQAAINLTAPLFISAFYWLRGHKEEADVKSGMGVVACAILLALMTI